MKLLPISLLLHGFSECHVSLSFLLCQGNMRQWETVGAVHCSFSSWHTKFSSFTFIPVFAIISQLKKLYFMYHVESLFRALLCWEWTNQPTNQWWARAEEFIGFLLSKNSNINLKWAKAYQKESKKIRLQMVGS